MNKKFTVGAVIAALIGLLGFFGSETLLELYDRGYEAATKKEREFVAKVDNFISINDYSVPLNSPVSGERLFVRWAWAEHPGTHYCYYYTIDGAESSNDGYHARIPGKCNPAGFSIADKPLGYAFNSSIGVQLPYQIPDGKYTLTYWHQEQHEYYLAHNIWHHFKPIVFEVEKK
ncbi:MAG: hypothetical protein MPJ08_09090 [Nitrosopumilus sp.]|nr:hypothetical protein [Nitrosopumilus sp.]